MLLFSQVVSKRGLLDENLCLLVRLVKRLWKLQLLWEKVSLFHTGTLASLGYYLRFPYVLNYWLYIKEDWDPQNGLCRRAGTTYDLTTRYEHGVKLLISIYILTKIAHSAFNHFFSFLICQLWGKLDWQNPWEGVPSLMMKIVSRGKEHRGRKKRLRAEASETDSIHGDSERWQEGGVPIKRCLYPKPVG